MYRERRQPRVSCPYCRRSIYVGYLSAHQERCKEEAQITMGFFSNEPDPQVPEDLGEDANGNKWTRTQFEREDEDPEEFTIGWTIQLPGK